MTVSAERISVITVVRNDLSGLQRTIESVQAQTSTAFEHVVWDGASDDGTPEWLAAISDRLRNFSWHSERDSGIFDAMNKATQLCTGQLLLYLNAGDTIVNADILAWVLTDWHAHRWRWAYGRTARWNGPRYVDRSDERPFRLDRFLAGRMYVPHQAAFITRDGFVRHAGFQLAAGMAADQDLLARFALESAPHAWPVTIANFQLGGPHSLISPRQRETEWRRLRDSNLQRTSRQKMTDAVRTEVRIRMLEARAFARPLKRRPSHLSL